MHTTKILGLKPEICGVRHPNARLSAKMKMPLRVSFKSVPIIGRSELHYGRIIETTVTYNIADVRNHVLILNHSDLLLMPSILLRLVFYGIFLSIFIVGAVDSVLLHTGIYLYHRFFPDIPNNILDVVHHLRFVALLVSLVSLYLSFYLAYYLASGLVIPEQMPRKAYKDRKSNPKVLQLQCIEDKDWGRFIRSLHNGTRKERST